MNSTTSMGSRPLAGAQVGIPPRNVQFQHGYLQHARYPVADNAFATAFIAVLSGIFPPGERFFVESVRHYRDRLTDPVLKAQVSGFIGQEALHGREHERLNEIFQAAGLRVDIAEREIQRSLKILERFSPEQQLACTLFMEHFTAIFGESFLQARYFRERCSEEALKLWTWHALEELEHKSVAFDVYTAMGGAHWRKLTAGPLVVAALLPGVLYSLGAILAADGQLKPKNLKAHVTGFKLLFGRRGLLKHVPRRMPDFFARRFHPSQDDTRALEAQWRERLFGASGWLAAEAGGRVTH